MDSFAEHYHRIAAALEYLYVHYPEQPDLGFLARRCGMSPSHFQRVFARWAGISPKRFLQHLTVQHAKAVLDGSASVLDAAFDSGLSGPGRLHDLFIACEGATPGEYKRDGQGVRISWGVHPSPLGYCVVARSPRGVCGLSFASDAGGEPPPDLHRKWQRAVWMRDQAAARATVEAVFSAWPERPSHRPSLHVRGTNFQISVWRALLRIPPGALVSYTDIAQHVDRPRATRAAASAVARNPVAYLIPCHRVIRNLGGLGGYRWGLERKVALLGAEIGSTSQEDQ